MIVDTSVLLALFNDSDPDHLACSAALESAAEPLVVSPFVVAEIDYMVVTRLGLAAELTLLAELTGGSWDIPAVTANDIRTAAGIIERYRDHEVGVTDASLVVLADRYRTRTIATLDRRHFDVLRPLSGGRFRVVP